MKAGTKQKEETSHEFSVDDIDVLAANLVVHNDNVNTFDWVIRTLVEVCEHSFEQAEQCSLLIHYKGKCAVKSGSYEELQDKRLAIVDRGINATIE